MSNDLGRLQSRRYREDRRRVLRVRRQRTLAVQMGADVSSINASGRAPPYPFVVDDAPLQRKLGIHGALESR